MKKAEVAKAVTLVAVILVMPLAGACSRPSPAPAPTPASTPAPAPAPTANPLAQIIDGAKKEGTVTVAFTSGFDTARVVTSLEKALTDKYGVALKINVTPAPAFGPVLAKAIMENQTGAVPTNDLLSMPTDLVPEAVKAGVVEMVDWRSLLEPGAPRELQYEHPLLKAGVVKFSNAVGLIYNPQKISAAEAPKKLSELVDPKWKGRFGLHSYAATWARYAFVMGKDSTMTNLRSIIRTNQPVLDFFPQLNGRFLAGELDIVLAVNGYVQENLDKGKPTAWQWLDFVEIRDFQNLVMKGVKHPNAAKLVALFFASPDGAKWTMEVPKRLHHLFPGWGYDATEKARRDGVPVYTLESFPGLLDFSLSPAYGSWQKEFQLIIDTK